MMLINGAPADTIPANDRGLAYGDGVFRTLRGTNGEPLYWPQHYAKLAADCTALAIRCPDESVLLAETRTAARAHVQAAVKIIVTRGSGPRGYAPPLPCTPLRVVMSAHHAPQPIVQGGINVHLCNLRLAHQPALAGVKHLNRLENVLARAEWNDLDIREGLLLDQDGYAVGGTMSNLFVVECGTLITPLLDHCGVAGVTRARVMAWAERSRVPCRIEPLTLQRVRNAAAIFFVNSLIGVWPVARLGDRTWPLDPITTEIRKALDAEDAALA